MPSGEPQQPNQTRHGDVKTVFFVEPVVFKGSFCDAFDGFTHMFVSEIKSEDISHDIKMF